MAGLSRPRWWGLRSKIIAWSFIPTALALVAVGLVSFYAFHTTTRFLLIERNRELIRLTAIQLAGEMGDYTDVLTELTRSPAFSGNDPAAQQESLKAASSSLTVFDGGVILTNSHGVVLAAEPERPEIIGQDWSNRGYFRELVRSREPAYSNVLPDGPGGVKSIVIAVPIISSRGEFSGMAAGMFRLDATNVSSFYGDIVKLRIGTSDYAHRTTYLVDRNGQIIYHTQGEQIGADFLNQPVVQNLVRGDFITEFSRLLPSEKSYGGSAGALRGQDITGKDVVAYYASIPGTSWGLVSESSWGELLSVYRGYLSLQSGLFALGVILPALIVGYGIRRITEPVYRLIVGAKEVAQGNFGQQIEVHSGDELEVLVDQFNQMATQLSQSYAAIQEREERLALVMQGTNDGIWDWNIQSGQVYFSPRWKSMLGYTNDEISDQFAEWRGLIHPEDVENAMRVIQAHLDCEDGLFHLEHRLRHKDGSYRWILARGITLRDLDGKPVRMVGSHSDITRRKEAEDELRQAYETLEVRVKERTRELATLNEISILVNRSLNLTEILGDVLDKTREVMGMEFGAAYRLEGERRNQWLSPEEADQVGPGNLFLNPLIYRGLSDEFIRVAGRVGLAGNQGEALIQAEVPIVWEVQSTEIASEMKDALQREQVEQVVTFPLRVKGRLVGAIQLGASQPKSFTLEELNLLAAIGRQVGVAVENARLHSAEREQLQRAVTLEERTRLARELHDSVTQSLYSVTLLAEASARLLLSGDNQTAAEHLRELKDTAQESLREMRLLIYELRPIALEKNSLADALRLRVESVEARSGIKAEFNVEGVDQLPYEEKMELYQIAQETLNNILKHAHASEVRINLRFFEGRTCLEVVDNGKGFDPNQAVVSGGLGLPGIAERVEKIGGRLVVDSAPGRGTKVRVEVGGGEGTLGDSGKIKGTMWNSGGPRGNGDG